MSHDRKLLRFHYLYSLFHRDEILISWCIEISPHNSVKSSSVTNIPPGPLFHCSGIRLAIQNVLKSCLAGRCFLVGGWTNASEKIWVKLDHLPNFRGKHKEKKILKLPPSSINEPLYGEYHYGLIALSRLSCKHQLWDKISVCLVVRNTLDSAVDQTNWASCMH